LEAQPQQRMVAACRVATAEGPAAAATSSPVPLTAAGIVMAASEGPLYILIHLRSIQSLTLHTHSPCHGKGTEFCANVKVYQHSTLNMRITIILWCKWTQRAV